MIEKLTNRELLEWIYTAIIYLGVSGIVINAIILFVLLRKLKYIDSALNTIARAIGGVINK